MQSLDDVVQKLREIFADDHVDVDEVTEILRAYKSNPKDWRQYAKFDTHKYTRNLVDTGNGKYNVMILCWGEGMGSSIHDHSNSHCFVKILQGTLQETIYEWPTDSDNSMRERCTNLVHENDVCYIDDKIGLHRVENPSHADGAVSLHVYIPPFDSCRTFDQRTGQCRTCPVTFWSKYGEKTAYEIPISALIDFSKRTNR